MSDVCIRRPAVELAVRRVRVHARRANSEDSIEVLSTTESIAPDDLTAITEEEAEHPPLANSFKNEGESLMGHSSDQVLKEETMKSVAASGIEDGEPLKEIKVSERRNGVQEDATQVTSNKPPQGNCRHPENM